MIHGGVALTLLDAVGGRALMGRAIPSTGQIVRSSVTATLTTDFTGAVSSGVRYACATIACGGLVPIGWYTRPDAFIAPGEMAVAYFIGHVPQGHFLSPLLNQGESAVLFCFVFLLLSVAGPGACSVSKDRA